MLTNCNALSTSRLKTVGPEFKKHIQLLQEMKKDLDYIYKKIRTIKGKLSAQYPEALAEAQRSSLAEECEEESGVETEDSKPQSEGVAEKSDEVQSNLKEQEMINGSENVEISCDNSS